MAPGSGASNTMVVNKMQKACVGPTQTATVKEAKGRQLWLRKQDRTWLKIGKTVALGLERHDYEALNYPNARAWMQDCIPNSLTWIYQALRAIKVLKGVPQAKLERLPRERVVELLRLPEKARKTPALAEQWVDRALAAPKAADVRKEVNVARGTPDEACRPWHMVLPESIYDELMDAEKKIAGLLGLDIEQDRKLRIVVWSRIAALINTTEPEHLRIEMEGGEAA